jgi:AraC family transcriptional regulator of adaptative response/methylated-DNA-[protein]-cysteine methyltransferase
MQMETQETLNYERVAAAIHFIRNNFREQPSLDEVAASVHLSPYHFQRLFTDWAGVSPKTFLQFISIEHAKQLLKDQKASLLDTAFETGLSGSGRLHDLFINIEGMTPGEYKNGGESLTINYSYAESPFGNLLVASTPKGICYMAFADDKQKAIGELQKLFPKAKFNLLLDLMQQQALNIFREDWSKMQQIKLHLKGTPFQLKVWESLLKIPAGNLSTYSKIASALKNPRAFRAVGSAVANNPVAFLIPCHRVIQAGGNLGQYHWGSNRKAAMIGWESAKTSKTA